MMDLDQRLRAFEFAIQFASRASRDDIAAQQSGENDESVETILRVQAALSRLHRRQTVIVGWMAWENPFVALPDRYSFDDDQYARREVQWQLTDEGHMWFLLGYWSVAEEHYMSATQLALLNEDPIAATQNAANLARVYSAVREAHGPAEAVCRHLVEWASPRSDAFARGLLADALTILRMAVLKSTDRVPDVVLGAEWLTDLVGPGMPIPYSQDSIDMVGNALDRAGHLQAKEDWTFDARLVELGSTMTYEEILEQEVLSP